MRRQRARRRAAAGVLGGLGPRARRAARAHGRSRRGRVGARRRRASRSPTAASRSTSSLEPAGEPVEVVSRHGDSLHLDAQAAGARDAGASRSTGRALAVDAPGLIDDSAGYHARAHRVGVVRRASASTTDGRGGRAGTSSPASTTRRVGSERTVWVDGVAARGRARSRSPRTSTRVRRRRCASPPEAERVRRDDLLLVASDYRQPFGTFSGTLPGGIAAGERLRRHGAPPRALVTVCLARPRPTRSRDRRRSGRRRRPGPAAGAGARAGRRRPARRS